MVGGNSNHFYSPRHAGMDGGDLTHEDFQDIFGIVSGGGVGIEAATAMSLQNSNVHHQLHFTESHSDLNSLNDPNNDIHHSYQMGMNAGGNANNPLGSNITSSTETVARTERKRSREKQRRLDVNKQFTELSTTVRQIECEMEEYRAPTMFSPSNRADLIAHTVSLLSALHEMNQKKNADIQNLQEELQRVKLVSEETAAKLKESMLAPQNLGNNKVLMMVPMMISNDNAANNGANVPLPNGAAPAASSGMTAVPTQVVPPNMSGMSTIPPAAMPFMIPSPAMAAPTSETLQQAACNNSATGNDAITSASAMNATAPAPWGMMPPWMMQHMMMMPSPQMMMMMPPAGTTTPPNTTLAGMNTSALSNPSSTDVTTAIPAGSTSSDQKVAAMSTNSDGSPNGMGVVGSNLAHCA